jgi:beta-hydroxylase
MYLFSAVKARPYADVRDFPELRQVTEQWRMIREEAVRLFDEGHIRAASGYTISASILFSDAAGSASI